MEKIIARAGVGRGTLYRNFESRTGLLIAVFERELDQVDEALSDSMNLEQAIETIAIAGRRTASLFQRVAGDLLVLGPHLPALHSLGERFEKILTPALQRSLAAGEVASSTTVQQAVLTARMVGSLVLPNQSMAEMQDVVRSALCLVMTGLRPRQ